ncbi:FtsX-like permease family protein [Lacticaseibacillus baoqingensis]|uniref:FtsX-like permease family protein n=1 Tax=Lacticaseibacillus baoqingensis TaxID=2486013 RepID=A0ABW4E3B3_9LACO|nr:FtsX-like permease family protein [Lacticaseibacillus baoqingensis]
MLRKLALGGIRSRFRDYAVLFSGLVIASAVFYMFLALATNTAFLKSNSPVAMASFIFGFGEVLLVIITMVYIVYANTFLMSMRQRDYAMFMMLGAKGRKIGQLIFIETVSVGLLASVVGVLIGMGLTSFAGNLLIGMLHAPATHFSPFWAPALLWTFGFFMVMFVIAAFFNAAKLLKTPMLALLHAATTPNRIQQKQPVLFIQAVLALVLLAIGYWAMTQLAHLQLMAIGIALVTIVLGTYFLFNSLLVWLIGMLKRDRRFAARGLHTFTLSQLSFRIRDYTKILSVVAMLFALALGAITVGLGFQHDINEMASRQTAYDVVTIDANAKTQQAAQKLTGVTAKTTYTQKVTPKALYFDAAQLDAKPLEFEWFNHGTWKKITVTSKNFARYVDQVDAQLLQFRTPADGQRQLQVVSHADFTAAQGQTRAIVTYQVRDFAANYDAIETMVTQQNRQYHVRSADQSGQKFMIYALINSMYSGFAFMGFFLGIAFLAMLASTLMFKILSGAGFDAARYAMLQKIGVRPSLLRRSIRQEIGALFIFPGALGVIHVLFGLKMFKGLLQHPYGNLLVPFGIFIVLYAIYYGLTVWIYERIVLTKPAA